MARSADLFAAILDAPAAAPPDVPDPGWAGRYIDPQTDTAARIEKMPDGRLRLHYTPGPEMLSPTAPGDFKGGSSRLHQDADGVWMDRAADHQSARLIAVTGEPTPDIAGVFHSEELGATFTCAAAGEALYGAFSGDLGAGVMQNMLPYATDIWLFPCPRALDFSPPGDWTVHIRRDGAGTPTSLEIGCWLARRVVFTRA